MVLDKMPGLGRLLSQKAEHPLADARELRRVIGELPGDNAFKALDEIAGWLESLLAADEFPLDRVFDAASQLEDAALPHLKRLSREYLHTLRLTRNDEKRLWSINYGFWTLLAAAYERCLYTPSDKPRAAETLKLLLPALTTRLIAALGAIIKWEQFHYGPTPGAIWLRLGRAMEMAEAAGVAGKRVMLSLQGGMSSAQQEYVKAVAFQAASMDSLMPLEIELAERLIMHFLPSFIFANVAHEDSVYWVDLHLAQPPLRLARMPARAEPSQRFFKPGEANAAMRAVLHDLEQGGDIPPDINLGGQYQVRAVLPVLRHLAAYLAPIPPQRRHDRHRVKHRMSVMNGLVNAFVVFSGEFGGRPAGLPIESWVVENVSRGGFGAVLSNISAEWLRVGALLALQPDGGDNWLLGIVRRYHRETESEARVGIQALARQVCSVEVTPRTASKYGAAASLPSLLIEDGCEAGEVRLVLPPNSFDLRESLDYSRNGQRFLLAPVALLEQTGEYELARYRRGLIS
ncbi:hypothetical protein [Quatrionicoccus australiensis]|uniref:hypothetical protein n=1 Tax=Quatrionicoccus australiensis TaxID=138118 RepID=UPI001CF871E8|nr:hypothetical protein [Quatrionicoccus australiensis]